MKRNDDDHIATCVGKALENYFQQLEGEKPAAVYEMVIKSVERPMLEVVLKQAGGNQTWRPRSSGSIATHCARNWSTTS
jgi:Fis family transcriptional regulator